jgi:hypothetical protein
MRKTLLPVLLVLTLAGCTGAAPDRDDTSTPGCTDWPDCETGSTASPDETTPRTDGTAAGDPATWVIGFTEVGPLSIGGSIDEARGAMTAFADASAPDECPLVVFDGIEDDVPTIWAEPDAGLTTIAQLVVTGSGGSTEFTSGSPRTADGIGVGSTREQLLAAYPGIEQQNDDEPPAFAYYALTDGSGRYIDFAVDGEGRVDSIALHDSPVPPSEYCG